MYAVISLFLPRYLWEHRGFSKPLAGGLTTIMLVEAMADRFCAALFAAAPIGRTGFGLFAFVPHWGREFACSDRRALLNPDRHRRWRHPNWRLCGDCLFAQPLLQPRRAGPTRPQCRHPRSHRRHGVHDSARTGRVGRALYLCAGEYFLGCRLVFALVASLVQNAALMVPQEKTVVIRATLRRGGDLHGDGGHDGGWPSRFANSATSHTGTLDRWGFFN